MSNQSSGARFLSKYSRIVQSSVLVAIAAVFIIGGSTVHSAQAETTPVLGVTQTAAIQTFATAGGGFDQGWKWVFNVTVPNNETVLKMKFADWIGTTDSIPAANNIRFYSNQSTNATASTSAITISGSGVLSAPMYLDSSVDLDKSQDGRQIQIMVEVQVPLHSNGGSYSTSYGINTADVTAPVGGDLNWTTVNHPAPATVVANVENLYNITPAFTGTDRLTSLSMVVTDLDLKTMPVPVYIDGSETSNGNMVYSSGVWNYVPGTAVVFSEGVHNLVATFSDNSGNTTKLTAQFTTDSTAPTATVSYSTTDPTNHDVVATITPSETVIGDLTHNFTENGSFTFDFTDLAGNTGSVEATVSNIDTTNPSITAPEDITTEATGANTAVDLGTPEVSDNSGVAPTVTNDAPLVGFPVGTTVVTWTATDAAGNTSTATQTVTITDTISPIILGTPSDIIVESASGSSMVVTYTLPTATDLVDGALAVSCVPASGSTFTLGVNTVTCTATDAAGNASTSIFHVTVQDTIAPTATVVHDESAKTITYTFSEPVQLTNNDGTPIDGTIASKLAVYSVIGSDYTTATKVTGVDITNATVSGNVWTLTYTGTLVAQTNTKYIVDAWGYKIADLAGNKILPAESEMFTVTGVDTIAPTVISVDASTPGTITYTFSEPMQLTNNDGTLTTLTPDKLAIYVADPSTGNYGLDTKTTNVITSATLNGNTLTILYSGSLVKNVNTSYVVDAWGYKITDLADNRMAPALNQIFTIAGDTTPPTATVAHDESAKTITYTFSEPVQLTNNDGSDITGTIASKLAVYSVIGSDYTTATKVTGVTIIDATVSGNVWTLTYTGTLVAQTNTKYVVDAWGYKITDLVGNQMVSDASQMFTVISDNQLITISSNLSGGSISAVVQSGSNPKYEITADPGYYVFDVLVDGNSVIGQTSSIGSFAWETASTTASYTFTNVIAPHTLSAVFTLIPPTPITISVSNLQPDWTTGVWAAYYAPDSQTSGGVSPGSTAVFDGREAGIIKAGITPEPSESSNAGQYMDEGLLAFQVNGVDLSTFASQTLTYDVQNQTGTNPVWVRIRLVGGTQYQFIPTTNPAGWHTVDAAIGQWKLMDSNGNGVGSLMTLSQVAAANSGAHVDRVYLTLGMGDSYNVGSGVGTVAWVDTVTIGGTTYNFVAPAILPGTLSAQDFGVWNASLVKGYSAGFNLADATFTGATSIVVQLYSGSTLLQTDTATNPTTEFVGLTQISSPFDLLGSFDYPADGYWTNVRGVEYGQTMVPTRVVATVTLANGKVVTAENTNLTGDLTTLFPTLPSPATVDLLSADNYAILAKTAVTTVGTTVVTGNIGISPAFASNTSGFSPVLDSTDCFSVSDPLSLVIGKIYAADYSTNGCATPAILTTAVSAMEHAYTDAAGRPHGVGPNLNRGGGTLADLTLAPGVYTWGSNVTITGDITLSGNATDVWIFQISGTLGIDANKKITLSGEASPKNIFWQVTDAVTLQPGSHLEGNILAETNIAMQTGATLNGRALAQSAVTLDANTVTAPLASIIPPSQASNPITDAATGMTSTDATLNGTNGPADATGHSFWVSTATFSTASPSIPIGVYSTPDLGFIAANAGFSASLSSITTTGVPTNLPAVTPDTTYYFVAWSHVGKTWYPGEIKNFTTDAAANPVTQFTVTFNSEGGNTVDPITGVTSGAMVTLPTAPTRDGYTFNGWFTSAIDGTEFTASTPVTADITVYAQWTAVEGLGPQVRAPYLTLTGTPTTVTADTSGIVATGTRSLPSGGDILNFRDSQSTLS